MTWAVQALGLLPPALVWPFAQRYVAGVDEDAVLQVVRRYNDRGIRCTVDLLGESSTDWATAEQALARYQQLLGILIPHTASISIKLSQLGVLLDPQRYLQLMRTLLQTAHAQQQFVRIDMEDSSLTQTTLELYRKLRQEFGHSVGVVLQAYLRRTHSDALALLADGQPTQVRVCKGIYREPWPVAYHHPKIIRDNYTWLLETLLDGGATVAIATHDEQLVWAAERLLTRYPQARYEFQTLYGVNAELEDLIVSRGHPLRVYVPYGADWHAYCMRRFAENPRVMAMVLENVGKSWLKG
jgi:proline dehydrogenase